MYYYFDTLTLWCSTTATFGPKVTEWCLDVMSTLVLTIYNYVQNVVTHKLWPKKFRPRDTKTQKWMDCLSTRYCYTATQNSRSKCKTASHCFFLWPQQSVTLRPQFHRASLALLCGLWALDTYFQWIHTAKKFLCETLKNCLGTFQCTVKIVFYFEPRIPVSS